MSAPPPRSCLRVALCLALATAACSAPARPLDAPTAGAGQPAVERRVIVSLGRSSGQSVLTRQPDGSMQVLLEVLENGRGPRTEATFALAADGTFARFEARGHHSFGATFTATFERQGAAARWRSTEEQGQAEVSAPALYYPVAELPEIDGILLRAALAAGGSLRILPAGTARVEEVGRATVTASGQRRELRAWAIHGVSFLPRYTWQDADGAWFGSVSEWFSAVPQGWEAAIEPLLAEQRAFDRARDRRLADQLAQRYPAAGVALTNARVLDVESGRYLPEHTVLVVGSRIAAVGPSKTLAPPPGAQVIDLGGKVVLPGLFDLHVHLDDADGILHLASGVTTVRDVGNQPDKLDEQKRAFDEGAAIGPHVVRYGFVEGRNPKAASSVVTAETEAEALAAVELFAKRGYEGVKIYNSMRPELVPIIAAAAHRRGLKVTGHVPVHMFAREVVEAGYDGVEHINMLFLNFLASRETDTRDTTRFTLVGERGAELDLASAPVTSFVAMLRARQTLITPTVNAFEDLLVWEQGKVAAGLEELAARLPVLEQRPYLMGGLPVDGAKRQRYVASFGQLLRFIKLLADAKVPLAIGTDALAGLMYHHELALFARAGLAPAEILRLATIEAARHTGKQAERGSIAVGKLADLVVVDGDPLARIEDARRTVLVLRAGTGYSCAALYQALGVQPL